MNINILKEKNRPGILGANITKNLKNQYSKRSLRVIKGDTVRILRGEYKGIEGKIEKVNTKRGTVSIEGVQREKIKGGNVKVQIHASNVQIISLEMGDPLRANKLKDKNETTKKPKEGAGAKTSKKRRSRSIKKIKSFNRSKKENG
jgi:large subunit ribosomal protein L24